MIEEFCIECDTSSRETVGEYIDSVWWCLVCKKELNRPEYVSDRVAKKALNQVIEKLEQNA